jgi:hypothetical protein
MKFRIYRERNEILTIDIEAETEEEADRKADTFPPSAFTHESYRAMEGSEFENLPLKRKTDYT